MAHKDPYETLTRGDFYIELLACWEYLALLCEQPPSNMGKLLMLNDVTAAINMLKRTYETEELTDLTAIEEELNGESRSEDPQQNLFPDGTYQDGLDAGHRSEQPDGSTGEGGEALGI